MGRSAFSSFVGDAEFVEDRVGAGVEFDAADQRRLEALHEAEHALVELFVIDPDGLERRRELVAQNALHQIEIVVQQNGRGLLLGLLAHVEPEVVEEVHVALQFFFGLAFAGGAADEAAGNALAMGLQDLLEALALFVGRDLAGDADVVDRRHVDDEAAGQRDVRSDARALLAEGFLGDLDDDLLAFFEKVGDGGERRAFAVWAFGALGAGFLRALGAAVAAAVVASVTASVVSSVTATIIAASVVTIVAAVRAFGLAGGRCDLGRFNGCGFGADRFGGWSFGLRLGGTVLLFVGLASAHFAAHAAGDAVRVALALFAKRGGQAGRDAGRFGAFFLFRSFG